MHPRPNPDHYTWSTRDQDEYVSLAVEKYRTKRGPPWAETPSWQWSILRDPKYAPAAHKVDNTLIDDLYRDGLILGKLRCDRAQFQRLVCKDVRFPYRKNGKKWGHGWKYPGGFVDLKPSRRYQKPAAKIAQSSGKRYDSFFKQDWRDRKGFERDYRKPYRNHRRAGRWVKQWFSGYRRMQENKDIREMYRDTEYCDGYVHERTIEFKDSWAWD